MNKNKTKKNYKFILTFKLDFSWNGNVFQRNNQRFHKEQIKQYWRNIFHTKIDNLLEFEKEIIKQGEKIYHKQYCLSRCSFIMKISLMLDSEYHMQFRHT